MSAPTRNRAAAISGQGRWREPSRVKTFIAAKQSWASTIQPSPASGCAARTVSSVKAPEATTPRTGARWAPTRGAALALTTFPRRVRFGR